MDDFIDDDMMSIVLIVFFFDYNNGLEVEGEFDESILMD